MAKLSIFFLSLVTYVVASPTFRNMVIHEQIHQVPSRFFANGKPNAEESVTLRIALKSNNLPGLEEALYAASTPSSPLYGQHLTKEEVEAFVAPTAATTSQVNAWLSANNIQAQTTSPAGDWLSITIPVSQANTLLRADFTTFTNTASQEKTLRTLSYSVPSELVGHVDFIHPTVQFPISATLKPSFSSPNTELLKRQVPSSCATVITPACLQALYGIPATRATQSSNVLGVSGFSRQFANQLDLTRFLTLLRPDLPANTTFALQTLDGGSNSQNLSQAGVEADLNIQYAVGVASGVPTTFISVGPNNSDGVSGFLDLVKFLLSESNPPHVLTTSYGFDEPDLSAAIANSLCNAYMQLGARGVTVVFASGDGGVSGSQAQTCSTFIPTFPSSCPFITSVGATAGVTETSAKFSSGGFSNIFVQPSYQSTAVANYLSTLGGTNSGKFNRSGRAFPDVSAQGQNIEIFNAGQLGTVSSTGGSSPIFASVIALLNDFLISNNQPSLGFINPFLYSSKGSVLNDVTTGNNPGYGFPAVVGWDPVTGWGTPNFSKMLAAALQGQPVRSK